MDYNFALKNLTFLSLKTQVICVESSYDERGQSGERAGRRQNV